MIAIILSAVLIALSLPITAQDSEKQNKISALILQRNGCSSPQERAAFTVEIAKEKYRNQDHEGAFKEYLEIFEYIPDRESIIESSDYDEALKLYLSANNKNLYETSYTIINRYSPILKNQSKSHPVGLIIAAAYANLGDFVTYFDLLFAGYCTYPNHYLIHKSKAILHLKLFERCCPSNEKEALRFKLQNSLAQAAEQFPNDSSLYRLMIAYAADSQKKDIATSCLNRIINKDIFIPRTDLDFYIQNAINHADIQLAEQFVNYAKQKYEFSRTISAAQKQLAKIKSDREKL